TLAQRTASRYRVWLIVLLAFAALFGFVASGSMKLSDEIKEFMKGGNTAALEAAANIATIKGELDRDKLTPSGGDSLQLPLDDPSIVADTRAKITTLREKLQDVYYATDMMNERVNGIAKTTLFSELKSYQTGDLSRLPSLQVGYDKIQGYYQARREVSNAQQSVFILNSF